MAIELMAATSMKRADMPSNLKYEVGERDFKLTEKTQPRNERELNELNSLRAIIWRRPIYLDAKRLCRI
jgi:hypothetical protein